MGAAHGLPHYVYLPFRDWWKDIAVSRTVEHYINKYGENNILEGDPSDHARQLTPLDRLPRRSVLIIVGHGETRHLREDHEERAAVRKETHIAVSKQLKRTMTANYLAYQISNALLPKTHRVIKLSMCWSGGIWEEGLFSMTKYENEPNRTFFASHLAQALRRQGYQNILVGGPVGEVALGTLHGSDKVKHLVGWKVNALKKYGDKTINDNNERWVASSEAYNWYGPNGKLEHTGRLLPEHLA